MKLWRLMTREMAYRKGSAWLGVLAAAIAVAAPTTTLTFFRAHDTQARTRAAARESEIRTRMDELHDRIAAAMDALGFNVSLIPQSQNMTDWLSADFGAERMPVALYEKLKAAAPATLRAITPQLRRRMVWPETRWTVIVTGTAGRILGQDKQRDEIQRIEPGTIWLGHEIWRGQDLKTGQTVQLAGRSFRIARQLPQEGSRDDITIWMALSDAQDLLQERGFINEMVAIGTRAAWTEPGRMQREIEALAPELRVVVNAPRTAAALRARASAEHETLAMTKLEEEARTRTVHNRSRIALALNGLMALICGAWIALLAYGNTVERNTEAGLWFALGVPQGAVARLFAAKWLSLCLLGAALGLGAAPVLTRVGARWLPRFRLTDVSWRINADTAGLALLLALALAGLASWIPVRLAARRDPAALLKGE